MTGVIYDEESVVPIPCGYGFLSACGSFGMTFKELPLVESPYLSLRGRRSGRGNLTLRELDSLN
jgi:hypothetical protein